MMMITTTKRVQTIRKITIKNDRKEKVKSLGDGVIKFYLSSNPTASSTNPEMSGGEFMGLYKNKNKNNDRNNRLLMNLFNRNLNKSLHLMPVENFQKVIEENFSTHIVKFKYHNIFLDSTSLKFSGNHRGIDMARELNANADTKSSFQNNSTVILSTNNYPKCTKPSVIARLHVYPRRIQYANENRHLKFQRSSICSTLTMLNTNNIFSVQMIMEKMPRIVAENYRGNYMMTWRLKPFLLYNIHDPVTVQASETLQQHIDKFHNMINAPRLMMEQLQFNAFEITLLEFFKIR